MRHIEFIVLHCTAGPQNQKTEDILAFWKKKGWNHPGYHYEIDADGTIENLQPLGEIANGVLGYNENSVHISYKGGVQPMGKETPVDTRGKPVDNRTDAQKDAQIFLLNDLNKKFPTAVILGHRDFSPDKNRNGIVEPSEWMKTCPSFSVRTWLDEINFRSALQSKSYMTVANVNLRAGWSTDYGSRVILPAGTKVKFLGESMGWDYVGIIDSPLNLTGWIRKDLLKAA